MKKAIVIDWLDDVPNEAEIGIDVGQFGQRDLLAVREGGEADMWRLALDGISYPADKAIVDKSRGRMVEQLRDLHAGDCEPKTGVIIVTIEGVVSGNPDLFSMNVDEAFKFEDRGHADEFIDEFFDVIRHAVILVC
ncbi:MAG TPA: hypothetical protein VJS17_13205 [Pyrinomonadaceae bacterium]|nr:hypothetical protein [Pyrinomonadaceae bacterium]